MAQYNLFSSDESQKKKKMMFLIWRERIRNSASDLAIHISALEERVTKKMID